VVSASAPVIAMVSAAPTRVMVSVAEVRVMVSVESMTKLCAEAVAVIGFDTTMVVPLDETTEVPVGIPFPVMVWPFDTPVRLDTPVMDVLPLVVLPVTVTVVLADAAADIVMTLSVVSAVVLTTVAPAAIPAPLRVWPTRTELMLGTPVMYTLPEVS